MSYSLQPFSLPRRIGFISLTLGVLFSAAASAGPQIEKTARLGTSRHSLYELVVNPVEDRLYVASYGTERPDKSGAERDRGIFVVDPDTLRVRGLIALDEPVFGLGINTATQRLYGTNAQTGVLSVFDLKTRKPLAAIRHGDQKAHLRQVVVDEGSNTIYVSVVGGFSRDPKVAPPPSAVWVIDGASNTLAHVIENPVAMATGLALDAAAGRLYVADMQKNEIAEIDTRSREVLRRFASGGQPGQQPDEQWDTTNIALDAEGGRIFAANQRSGTLTVVELASGRLLQTIPTGKGAVAVRYLPRHRQIYVTNRNAGTTSVIDGATYRVLAQLPTGTRPQSIAYDARRDRVYTTNMAIHTDPAQPSAKRPEGLEGDVLTVIRP